MTPVHDISAIAEEMLEAQDEARQLPPITSRWPDFDRVAAYRVAARVHAARVARGEAPGGRKIGFTNRNIWDHYNVHEPIWAYVYDRTVSFTSGGRCRCPLDGLAEPRIEPEVVVHFAVAPPLTRDPASILECIDWIGHGFEIVQSHFPNWLFKAPDTIADGSLHGRLLVGEPQPVGRLGPDVIGKLRSFTIDLACNGEVRETGRGANVLDSPLAAIAHLIAVLAIDGGPPLAAGELVTTGTLTNAYPVQAGERWTTRLEGVDLPGLEIEFT